jgi:hypothetical protein
LSVQQRAMDAIAASERITQQQRVSSPGRPRAVSPGATAVAAGARSPRPSSGGEGVLTRSKSPPAGIYRTDAYSRTTFGAPPAPRNNKCASILVNNVASLN